MKSLTPYLFDLNHQMLTSQEVYEQHYKQKEPAGVKKYVVWDSIKKWIINDYSIKNYGMQKPQTERSACGFCIYTLI